MFCLACTGVIGSGKSYVAKIFSAMGFPAYIADEKTRQLYDKSSNLINKLRNLLGNEIVIDGVLQKKVMASKIFNNEVLLAEVNNIVHPEVFLDFSMWLHEKEEKGYKIVLLESAIIFSAPAFIEKIDAVLVVDAPEQVRIERVMKRDGISEIQVRERMRRQMSPGEMIKRADFIIYTDGRRAVLPQVINVIKEINKRLTK